LAPLSAAMQSIGGESYCSLSLVETLLHKLISKVMVPVAEDTPIVYDFKAAALSDLKQRYSDASITHLLSAATALDPCFRDFNFIRDANERGAKLQALWEALAQKAAEISAEEPNEPSRPTSAGLSSNDTAAEPPAKRARGKTDLVSFLTEDDTDQLSRISRLLNSKLRRTTRSPRRLLPTHWCSGRWRQQRARRWLH